MRFVTYATTIRASWTLRRDKFSLHNMAATGVSGVDLYVRELGGENTAWRFLAVVIPKLVTENDVEVVARLKPGKREYRLHLPLYNDVSRVEIGVPQAASIEAPPTEKPKLPVVFYGKSIVQGAVASRPGMSYPAQVARALSVDALNMGFSGACQIEPASVGVTGSRSIQRGSCAVYPEFGTAQCGNIVFLKHFCGASHGGLREHNRVRFGVSGHDGIDHAFKVGRVVSC